MSESLDDFLEKEETPQRKVRIHTADESTCTSCEG